MYLVFSFKTHPDAFARVEGVTETGHQGKQRGPYGAVISLIGASVLSAWMSEILVGTAEGTGRAFGMSQTFIGIVFIAVIGVAAESESAVVMAYKNRIDLSAGIEMGSSIQIALFVASVLVLASHFIAPHPLNLSFNWRDRERRWPLRLVQRRPVADHLNHLRHYVLLRARGYALTARSTSHLSTCEPE